MATSKKSAGGRSKAPSKAAASKGGRNSGGASKKSAGGSSRGGATKATAPKKAAASKSAGGRGGARGAAGSTATARGGAASGRGAASKKAAASKKSTASRGGGNARGAAGSTSAAARGGRNSGGGGRGAASKATASRGGRGSAATASRGSTGATASHGRGAQQSSDPRNDLDKLMRDGLKDIYYAEKKLITALGKMSKNAQSEELKAALDTHRAESEEQVSMLEQAFEALGEKAKGKKCAAMDGIIEEGNEHMQEYGKGPARDAVIIVSAQKSEHYEIAAYGTLRTFANLLGNNDVAQIFEQILDQEKATDEKLTGLSDSLNREALRAHNETDESSDDRSEGGEVSDVDDNASTGSRRTGGMGSEGGGAATGGGRSDAAPAPEETLDITV